MTLIPTTNRYLLDLRSHGYFQPAFNVQFTYSSAYERNVMRLKYSDRLQGKSGPFCALIGSHKFTVRNLHTGCLAPPSGSILSVRSVS